jgi:hypothetical protein
MTKTESKQHGRGRYVIAIVAVGIIALLIGVFYGTATAPAAVTLLEGRVALSAQDHGTAYSIAFANMNTHNLTSTITNQTYLLYLPTGLNYVVSVQWINMTAGPYFGVHNCNPTPGTFNPSGQNETQNFAC